MTAARRITVLAGTMAVALIALGLGSASAHTSRTSSQHTLSLAAGVFSGQLRSASASCKRGRAIEIYRAVGDASVADERIATAKGNRAGGWFKNLAAVEAGEYYSVATKKVKRNARHKHVCKCESGRQLAGCRWPPTVAPALLERPADDAG